MAKKELMPPLSKTHPKLAEEADGWDPTEISISSNKTLTWKCSVGHVWEAKPHHILNGTWCPNCAGIENWKKQKQKNK